MYPVNYRVSPLNNRIIITRIEDNEDFGSGYASERFHRGQHATHDASPGPCKSSAPANYR